MTIADGMSVAESRNMFQQSFFENTSEPQKIKLVPDFITEQEEEKFLKHFKNIEWQKIKMHGVVAKRRVAHYGLDYTYTSRSVQETHSAPKWLRPLIARAAKLSDLSATDIKEILVTYYPAGAGIGWHKDAEAFGDAIVGVSFLSDCTMKFRNPETSEVFKLDIPRRSAYLFSGEARWKWQHSISNHSQDRYSITFRTLNTRQKPI